MFCFNSASSRGAVVVSSLPSKAMVSSEFVRLLLMFIIYLRIAFSRPLFKNERKSKIYPLIIKKIASKNNRFGINVIFLAIKILILYTLDPYIFIITSTKNSLSLLLTCTEPPYFSAAAAMEISPVPLPLCLVEQYPFFPFRTFPSKLLVDTI